MKNLMTQKITLGLLMAFVLVLGVQGIAEALTITGTAPTPTQVYEINGGLGTAIALTVTLNIDDTVTVDANGDGTADTITVDGSEVNVQKKVVESVSVSANGFRITSPRDTTSFTLTEVKADDGTTSNTWIADASQNAFTLSGYFTRAGKATITVRDNTTYPSGYSNSSFTTNPARPETTTYTFYVVEPDSRILPTTTILLDSRSTGYKINVDGRRDFVINNGSGNYRVNYAVAVGSGSATNPFYTKDADENVILITAGNPISSAVKVYLNPNGTALTAGSPVVEGFGIGPTNTVTVTMGAGSESQFSVPYIYGRPQLTVTGPGDTNNDIKGTNTSPAGPGVIIGNTTDTNPHAFRAVVTDESDNPVPHALVQFTATDGTRAGGDLIFTNGSNTGTLVDLQNRLPANAVGDASNIESDSGKTLYVRASDGGVATVSFQLGTAVEQKVSVRAVGLTDEISAFTQSTSGLSLSIEGTDKRPGSSGLYDLYVRVENDGERVGAGWEVEFDTTRPGTLEITPPGTGDFASGTRVKEDTDTQGIAHVVYDPKNASGSLVVTASIRADANEATPAGEFVDDVTFNVSGGGADPPPPRDVSTATPDRLRAVSGSGQSGAAGTALSNPLIVELLYTNNRGIDDVPVDFQIVSGSGTLSTSSSNTDSSGRAQTTLTLGPAAGTTTVRASVAPGNLGGHTVSSVTFTATATGTATQSGAAASRLEIDLGNNQSGNINRRLPEEFVVRLVDSNGDGVSGQRVRFSVIEGSGRPSPSSPRTDSAGYASTSFTPTSSGTIEVEASFGDLSPVTFIVNVGEPPAALVYISGNNQSGRPGTRLANPFVVEVVDENDDPVSGASVTFAVTAGSGSLSVTSVTTNGTGRAQTYLRLGDEVGENTVVARVTGLTAVTFTAISGAEVLVSAAQRPPMYWISRTEGKLHRLVDAEVENLAPNIDDILSLTVDTQNQLLYWTRQTAQSKSAIQRAGLNGRGVITLQTSLTLMTSIAVDSTGTTLYWADILGKIKSRPVQGNRVTLLAQNLSSPTGLVWSNEYLYWGEATGQIRRMNLRNNRRTIETITTSSGEPVSLAVRSGRVYWTEISGNAAQLNRVNTNGTGVEALKTLAGSRRVWIDVDGSSSKLYLTRASKLERRGLSGRSTVTLVSGLASPGSLVLGGELVATPPVVSQPTQPTQPTPPTAASKYDVNEDGVVNNADLKIVSRVITGAATNARADVDGSGTVDVTDLILVIGNLDDDAAAPMLDLDVKALDIDFDRVQEQVEVLLASGDRSIAAQRALLYLQHLLASARPDETVLLANYPNPFNPETWIPYHLAESTDVRVNIYDAQGTVVRVLTLGHQTAGYYTSRSRAAYWDGRNALGERVASGIYFYQLQTDAVSPMRKMVILK